MGRTALVFVALLAAMGVTGQQRLVFVPQTLNWSEAQAHCRQHHLDLVKVKTSADNDQMDKDTWLGLHRDDSNAAWKWSRGNQPHTFPNTWNHGDPHAGENSVHKRAMDYGSWRSSLCGDACPFFCLDDSLFLALPMMTWEEALVHCRSLSSRTRRYNLASLLTPDDHSLVKAQTLVQLWTGLRFLGDGWVWVGGEDVQYHDITPCPEENHCGGMDNIPDKHYNTADCKESMNFFCYKKPPYI